MIPLHNIFARTNAHATEVPDAVRTALRFFVGDAGVEESVLEGHHGNPILQLEARLERAQEVKTAWKRLVDDAAVRERFTAEIGRRIDDSCNFFFRLDKQEAFLGRFRLAEGDDTVQCRAKIKVFPARREAAERALLESLAGN